MNNLAKDHKSRLIFLGILAMIFTGVVLYSNILQAPFVFDDYSSIIDNETIKSLKASFRDILNNRYITKIDSLVKSRHSRESGNPESMELLENTGFPFARE